MQTLWTAGLAASPFAEQVAAACAADFPMMSVGLESVAQAEQSGQRLPDLRQGAADAGIELGFLEALMAWLPVDDRMPLGRFSVDEAKRIALELGIPTVCFLAVRDHGLSPLEVAERFAVVAEAFRSDGLTTMIEFAPMSGIRTFADALALVEAAGDDSKIVFDTWHYYRAGGQLADIASLPAGRIGAVQVSDALASYVGSLTRDTYERLLPGSGSFPLIETVRSLQQIGAFHCAGPEVISTDMAAMNPSTVAQSMARAYREVVAAAAGAP
jgi:sugar phosphate isomerase/epimerase